MSNNDYTKYYRPLGDRLMVNPVRVDRDPSGLILPESALPAIRKALVMKCGPGTPSYPMPVKATDIILIPRSHGFKKVQFNNVEFLILRSQDIIAIV